MNRVESISLSLQKENEGTQKCKRHCYVYPGGKVFARMMKKKRTLKIATKFPL